MKFIGKIYKPNKTKSKIILEEKLFWYGTGICILSCIILILNDETLNFDWLDTIFKTIGILSIIVALLGKISAMFRNEPLNGNFDGLLVITSDYIKIKEFHYNLKDILNLEINLVDYYGKMYAKYNYPGPWGSNGIDNKISFKYQNLKIEKQFIIENKTDFNKLEKIKLNIKNTLISDVYN